MNADDLLLSNAELAELSEPELVEYEEILAGELGGTEMDWRDLGRRTRWDGDGLALEEQGTA